MSGGPHSIESEQSIIGSLLIEPAAWAQVCRLVAPKDFSRPDHQLIFEAIAALANAGKPHDAVTVGDYLGQHLESVGGFAYLSRLARETATAANAAAYARAVRERSTLRALSGFGESVARAAGEVRGDMAPELLSRALERLIALQQGSRAGRGLVSSEDLARELIDDLDRRIGASVGLSVGLEDFDALTCGLEPGDLVVIAARPGMGKTSLLVSVADHVASSVPVAVFSAEMPAIQLMRRCVSLRGSVSQSRMRRVERLSDADWAAIMPAAGAVGQLKLEIDDTALPPLGYIRAESFGMKARRGLGLILVDYVQLVVAGAGANRYEQLREVAYGFKAMAKDLAVPIIVLAQLNRSVEARDKKRPYLSDLRDSGAIEEAADIVGLLYSEGYYNRSFEMPHVIECALEKNRNGERGECLWAFAGEHSRMSVLGPDAAARYRQLRASSAPKGASDDL